MELIGVFTKWRGANTGKIVTTLKDVEELMIPPDGVKQKRDGVVDGVPPDKSCEALDGELTHECY